MKRLFTFIVLLLALIAVKAQTGTTAYEFMNIPTSAHGAAVGGNAVALIEDDIIPGLQERQAQLDAVEVPAGAQYLARQRQQDLLGTAVPPDLYVTDPEEEK